MERLDEDYGVAAGTETTGPELASERERERDSRLCRTLIDYGRVRERRGRGRGRGRGRWRRQHAVIGSDRAGEAVPAEHGSWGSLPTCSLTDLATVAVEARGGNGRTPSANSLSLRPHTHPAHSESLSGPRAQERRNANPSRTQWLSIPPPPLLVPSPPTANPSTCPTSSPTTRLSTT